MISSSHAVRLSRRALLIGLGALAAPSPSLAQRVHRIAILLQGSERTLRARLEALRAGLRELGYVEGKNLSLSVRWNEGGLERLSDLAAELLRDKPDVFVTQPVLSAAAVHQHTRTVPIVIAIGAGAVKLGLAKSFARPGGNVTGLESQNEELTQKYIELLKAIAPGVSRVGVLNSGNYIYHDEAWRAATQAAEALKLTLIDVRVGALGELARLATICWKGACDGLYVMQDPLFINWRREIIEQAAQLRLPAVYYQPEFAQDGGLLSYATNAEETFRRAAAFVDKILRGAKPGDLPIERPTRFELIINMKTARALGLAIPESIRLRADRIIE